MNEAHGKLGQMVSEYSAVKHMGFKIDRQIKSVIRSPIFLKCQLFGNYGVPTVNSLVNSSTP